jgi:ACT domain-containing protein
MAGQRRSARWMWLPRRRRSQGVADVLRKREEERAATEKSYTATVRVTIRAQDKREAKQILETLRSDGAAVETIEGPDLAKKNDGGLN